MSKALPIVVATLLGGASLVPIYYATQNPEQFIKTSKVNFDNQNATPIQKLSYAFGYEVTSQMTPPELDIAAFNAGAQAGHSKQELPFSKDELNLAYQEFNAQQATKSVEGEQTVAAPQQELAATDTTSADVLFLTENAKKSGVHTTASGLQYTIDKEGTGKQPKATDIVEVHYEGKLISGEIFDSSFDRKQSIEFPLSQVIPGWTEGLQLMKEGAEYTFVIPSELAYGAQGTGPIPPNSTLIFKVQLIAVK